MKNIFKFAALVFACVSLNACASGARPEGMVVTPTKSKIVNQSNKYFKSISVGSVSGGKETNPLWTSKVNNTAFEQALGQSLEAYGLLNTDGKPKYNLNAELLALRQPIMGLNFSVDSEIKYQLQSNSTKQNIFDETVYAKGTATMGDSVIGVQRLRMANEYSIKENIEQFVEKITP